MLFRNVFRNVFLILSLIFTYNSYSLDYFTRCFKTKADNFENVNFEELLSYEQMHVDFSKQEKFCVESLFKNACEKIYKDLELILKIVQQDHTKINFNDFLFKVLEVHNFLHRYHYLMFTHFHRVVLQNEDQDNIQEIIQKNYSIADKTLKDHQSKIIAKVVEVIKLFFENEPMCKHIQISGEPRSTLGYLKEILVMQQEEYLEEYSVDNFAKELLEALIDEIQKYYN